MEKSKKQVCRDWSNLNPDLLNLVASKVVSYSDFLSFKKVCSSWHMAAQGRNQKPFSFLMLVFVEDKDDSNKHIVMRDDVDDDVQFMTFNQKKPFKLFNTTCSVKKSIRYEHMVGSNSQGWLVMSDRTNQPYLLQLFSWTRIPLPKLGRRFDHHRIEKATLSSGNDSSNSLVLMVHRGGRHNKVFIWRTGDGNWTGLKGDNCIDIALCDNKVYTLCNNNGSVCVESFDFGTVGEERLSIEVQDLKYSKELYVKLVCSSEGDVLIVNSQNNKCRIWEVDLIEGRCEEVNSLKGNTLIIGDFTSVFVLAKEVEDRKIKPNSVYVVTMECNYHKYLIRRGVSRDLILSVYSMEDGKVERLWRSKRDKVSYSYRTQTFIPEPYLFGLIHGVC